MFSFKGRVSRSKFWWMFFLSTVLSIVFLLFNLLALPSLILIGVFSTTLASVLSLVLYVLIIPMWWVSVVTVVKRFHDRNKSGWWYLVAFVPVIGFFWIVVECGFLKGTTGANLFGEDPLLSSTTPATPSVFSDSVAQNTSNATGLLSEKQTFSSPAEVSTGGSSLNIILVIGVIILISGVCFGFWRYQHIKDLEVLDANKVSVAEIEENKMSNILDTDSNASSTTNFLAITSSTTQSMSQKVEQSGTYEKPTVRFWSDADLIPYNSSTVLRWNVSNSFSSCTLINKTTGAVYTFTKDQLFKNTGNLTQTESYSLYCEGQNGRSSTVSTFVTVKPKVVSSTQSSGIMISNLSHTSLSLSKINSNDVLSFDVTNAELGKEICVSEDFFNSLGGYSETQRLVCNPYEESNGKLKNSYFDPTYFFMLNSGTYSPEYFSARGIVRVVQEFYIKDINGKESNHLKLTFTK